MSEEKLEHVEIVEAIEIKTQTENKTNIEGILKTITPSNTESETLEKVIKTLEKHGWGVGIVSERQGIRILLAEKEEKRYLIWIRQNPVSRKSLELAEKIIKPYEEITEKILLKTTRKPNYIPVRNWKNITV